MSGRERVASVDDVPSGSAHRVLVGGRPVALVRIDDDFYAIGDICSHENVSLSEGEVDVDECTLECWKHGSAFDLRTGQPSSLPATRPVPTYVVTRNGDDLFVDVPAEEGSR